MRRRPARRSRSTQDLTACGRRPGLVRDPAGKGARSRSTPPADPSVNAVRARSGISAISAMSRSTTSGSPTGATVKATITNATRARRTADHLGRQGLADLVARCRRRADAGGSGSAMDWERATDWRRQRPSHPVRGAAGSLAGRRRALSLAAGLLPGPVLHRREDLAVDDGDRRCRPTCPYFDLVDGLSGLWAQLQQLRLRQLRLR